MPKLQQLVFLPPQGTAREPFTTSEIIADVAGVRRHAVNQLIQKHKADFEEFGILAFEMPKKTGRGRPERNYRLNEQQATLLMTYEIYTDLQTRLSGIQTLVGHAQAAGEQLTLEAGKDTTGAAKRGRKENKHE